jgi:hypothetical protein
MMSQNDWVEKCVFKIFKKYKITIDTVGMPRLLNPNKCDYVLTRGTRDGKKKSGDRCDKPCGQDKNKCALHQNKYLESKKIKETEKREKNEVNKYLIKTVKDKLNYGMKVDREEYILKKIKYHKKIVDIKRKINGIDIYLKNKTIDEIKYENPKFYFGNRFIKALQDAKIEKTNILEKINEEIRSTNEHVRQKEWKLKKEKEEFVRIMNIREQNTNNSINLREKFEEEFKELNKDKYDDLKKDKKLDEDCRLFIRKKFLEYEEKNNKEYDPFKYDNLFKETHKLKFDEIEEIKTNCPYGIEILSKRQIFGKGILKLTKEDFQSKELLKMTFNNLYDQYECDNSYLFTIYSSPKYKAKKEYEELNMLMNKYKKKYNTYIKILNMINEHNIEKSDEEDLSVSKTENKRYTKNLENETIVIDI